MVDSTIKGCAIKESGEFVRLSRYVESFLVPILFEEHLFLHRMEQRFHMPACGGRSSLQRCAGCRFCKHSSIAFVGFSTLPLPPIALYSGCNWNRLLLPCHHQETLAVNARFGNRRYYGVCVGSTTYLSTWRYVDSLATTTRLGWQTAACRAIRLDQFACRDMPLASSHAAPDSRSGHHGTPSEMGTRFIATKAHPRAMTDRTACPLDSAATGHFWYCRGRKMMEATSNDTARSGDRAH